LLPLIQGASSAAGGYAQQQASVAQGRYARSQGDMNATLAARQASEAERVGEIQAGRRLQEGAQAASSERARLAAQGVNPNTGSAAQVQGDIKAAAAEDAATIRHNAALEAWGYGMESIGYKHQGRMGYLSGKFEGRQSLIQGGLGFAQGLAMAANEYGKIPQKPKEQPRSTPSRTVRKSGGMYMSDWS
jgi:hypothetical protein